MRERAREGGEASLTAKVAQKTPPFFALCHPSFGCFRFLSLLFLVHFALLAVLAFRLLAMLRLRSILQRCHPAHTSSPNSTSHLSPLEPFLPHHTRTGPFTSRRLASDRLAPSMALASVHRLSARGVRDDRIRRLSELETLAESSLARGWGLSKMVQCSVAGGGVEAVEERRGARMLEGAITTSSRRQVLSGLARILPAPRKTPISVRSYSTTPRELRVTRLADEFEPATVVDLGAIMDDLRDLELLDALRGSKQKSEHVSGTVGAEGS